MKNLFFFLTILFAVVLGNSQVISISGQFIDPSTDKLGLELKGTTGLQTVNYAKTQTDSTGKFLLEITKNIPRGLYRIQIEKTNGKFDLILNPKQQRIDVVVSPDGTLKISNSSENEGLLAVDAAKQIYKKNMQELQLQANQLSPLDSFFNQKLKAIHHHAYELENMYHRHLKNIQKKYPSTFLADVHIPLIMRPLMQNHPNWEAQYDNDKAFYHDHFFANFPFVEGDIVHHPNYGSKLYDYLTDYNSSDTESLKKAVDKIMDLAYVHVEVEPVTANVLLELFITLQNDDLVAYMEQKYLQGCEHTDAVSAKNRLAQYKQLSVGNAAPNLVATDLKGQIQDLQQITAKNTYTLLVFWASDCSHCRAEMPYLINGYEQFKDKSLGIVAVSLDEDLQSWQEATKYLPDEWIHIADGQGIASSLATSYMVRSTPTLYLINGEGKIVAKNMRGAQLYDHFSSFLTLTSNQ